MRIRVLVGKTVVSIRFILERVGIGFSEGTGLEAVSVWPEIVADGTRMVHNMDDYRNRLCALINHKVLSSTFGSNEVIVLSFDEGTVVEIPLRNSSESGERAFLYVKGRVDTVF